MILTPLEGKSGSANTAKTSLLPGNFRRGMNSHLDSL